MRIAALVVSCLAVLLLSGLCPAMAQTKAPAGGCPDEGRPWISVTQHEGRMYQSQTKTAFEIAREKSIKHGVKMPLRQGNIGRVELKTEIKPELGEFASAGCIVVKGLTVKVFVGHRIEIAKDYEDGSCMYNEFYNLEQELMQMDEEIINYELQKLQDKLKSEIMDHNTYGPVSGLDMSEGRKEKESELSTWVNGHIAKIEGRMNAIRLENDLPEFFDEIETECNGKGGPAAPVDVAPKEGAEKAPEAAGAMESREKSAPAP